MFNIILHSNLFNFTIFLLIIIVIAKKIDVCAMLNSMRDNVISKIDNSQEIRNKALEELENAKKSVSNTSNEIDEINKNAQKTSEIMKSKIIEDANSRVHSIAKNSKNIIANEEKQTSNKILSDLSAKSIELATSYIINEIQQNPQLHNKFIEESIQDLERAVL